MATPIEFWFEFASTYSYPGACRIEAVTRAANIEVLWKPFLLGPIFAEQGFEDSPFNLQPLKGRYMWRDLERLCEGYGFPFRKPSAFPRNGLLAARAACAGDGQVWLPDFVRAVYTANFADDRDIADASVIADCLTGCGVDAGDILERASSSVVKAQLRANTDAARERGIFGAPSFVVGGELFWGNDRLGDAVSFALLGG